MLDYASEGGRTTSRLFDGAGTRRCVCVENGGIVRVEPARRANEGEFENVEEKVTLEGARSDSLVYVQCSPRPAFGASTVDSASRAS